jgi:response regulator RpfG family c-di-GMP phosphodiesterase
MQLSSFSSSRALPLVLLVDPQLESRHWLWRRISDACGVVEAPTAVQARKWIAERPDIDAIIVEDELPDARGRDLVFELALQRHPIASRAIVLATSAMDWKRVRIVERNDVRAILSSLKRWFGY